MTRMQELTRENNSGIDLVRSSSDTLVRTAQELLDQIREFSPA